MLVADADKVFSSAYLRYEAFLINRKRSFKNKFDNNVPSIEPVGKPDKNSRNVLEVPLT